MFPLAKLNPAVHNGGMRAVAIATPANTGIANLLKMYDKTNCMFQFLGSNHKKRKNVVQKGW